MSAPVTDPFGLVGATLEGRFVVDRVVAKGGFGIVYQGRQLRLKKAIALKVLFFPDKIGPAERKAFLEGFSLAAQTIANLDHPAIVRVFNFGVSRARNGQELPWIFPAPLASPRETTTIPEFTASQKMIVVDGDGWLFSCGGYWPYRGAPRSEVKALWEIKRSARGKSFGSFVHRQGPITPPFCTYSSSASM
jgi:serine/threonine protein kinase